jgi:hypothetical protein
MPLQREPHSFALARARARCTEGVATYRLGVAGFVAGAAAPENTLHGKTSGVERAA